MDETKFLLELKFVSSLCFHKIMNLLCDETVFFLSLFSSDPLFHCVVTFCTLVFLYLPHLFLRIVLCPVLILTAILLISILRLGASQRSQQERKENQGKPEEPLVYEENRGIKCRGEKQSSNPIEPNEIKTLKRVHQWAHSETDVISEMGFESSLCFVEWNVKAPLEVIYEEYGEGEEPGDDANENVGIMRYPSLSRFYPESDSDSESESGFPAIGDWDSPEDVGFGWSDEEDEGEEREGLIEISLDGSKKKRGMEFNFGEENLIEIDISPSRYRELSGDDEVFSGEISCN